MTFLLVSTPPAPPAPAIQGHVAFQGLPSLQAPWVREASRPPFRIPPPRPLALDLPPNPRHWVNPWVDFAAILAFEILGGGHPPPYSAPMAPAIHSPGSYTWEWHPMDRTILVPRRP